MPSLTIIYNFARMGGVGRSGRISFKTRKHNQNSQQPRSDAMPYKTVLFSMFLTLLSVGASAADFGVNLGIATGDGDADLSGSPTVSNFEVDTQQINFALNACSDCPLFNYRLNVGPTIANIDYPEFGLSDDGSGISVINTFGVKLLNKDNFKIWVGASLYAAGLVVDGDVSDNDAASVWGGGPTLGLDLKVPDGTIFSFELGYRDLEVDIDQDVDVDYTVKQTAFSLSILW